ncbi:MAG TPA: hypothetical protein DHW61_02110 [Lachnoclostridium phytofermentans]|uniref:SH3b domain-containing protein n=1 Tax=Lachnoclostridium phytofermentans TaxID=66219 RepID=A0A3D2X254_9FIRM|nr:SH3 domain-containing protein [Lachnoclostridium sp.]HCL01201.1 hypothetical protein [Lachnoclostridium phytofermentans]
MKKLFKRFIAFAFAAALLLAPLSTPITTYAASQSTSTENIKANSNKGSYYTGTIEGTGVRFRSSPKVDSSNIIRTFTKGEKIGVYNSDINCAYADGYWWSYVEDKNGVYGYVASNYFSTDGIE